MKGFKRLICAGLASLCYFLAWAPAWIGRAFVALGDWFQERSK